MPDLQDVMEHLKSTSEEFAEGLPADGDWEPMLTIVNGEKLSLVGFQMAPNGDERENLFMNLIPNLIHEKYPNPDAVVILVSTWYVMGWEEGDTLPARNPQRKEALLLHGISKDKELTYMADIIRGESHPELKWISELDEAAFGGRLVGGLRRAVWS